MAAILGWTLPNALRALNELHNQLCGPVVHTELRPVNRRHVAYGASNPAKYQRVANQWGLCPIALLSCRVRLCRKVAVASISRTDFNR